MTEPGLNSRSSGVNAFSKRKHAIPSQSDEDISSPTSPAHKKQKKDHPKPLLEDTGKTMVKMTHLTDLVNKTFQIFKSSPLYNFHRQLKDLKIYSNKLRHRYHELAGVPEEVKNVVGVNISFIEDENDTVDKAENKSIGVAVAVKDEDRISYLQALLFYPGNPPEKENKDQFVHFPIILIKGSIAMTHVFIQWLQESFDCYISLLSIPSYYLSSLIMLAVLDVDVDINDKKILDKPVEITFFVPTKGKENKEKEKDNKENKVKIDKSLKSFSFSISTAAIIKLHDSAQGDNSEKYINQSLNNIFKSYFQIDLSALSITRVCTWAAMIGYDGKIKLFAIDYVAFVLRKISELVTNKNVIVK